METIQQDENTITKSGADGESNVENDGHELEAQGTGTGTVCDAPATLDRCATSDDVLWLTGHGRLNQHATSAPSGIARLRKSLDETNNAQDDPMNIDDYIFPGSIASPTGMSPSPPSERTPAPSTAMASAIPIKTKKDVPEPSHPDFPPSAPPQDRSRSNEFGYVQRRVRKTSIDETRVRKVHIEKMKVWV